MKMLIFLIFSILHTFSSPQCLPTNTITSCLICEPSYYDSNFLIDLRLSYSKSQSPICILKTSTTIYTQKILITNQISCNNEDLTGFDKCYTSLLVGFQAESRNSLLYNNSSIEFLLRAGDHYINQTQLEVSEEELFRQIKGDFFIGPNNSNEMVNIWVNTNEFYIFSAGNFIIENLTFHGEGIDINETGPGIAYIEDNDSGFALFNSEALIGSSESATIKMTNCNFYGFKLVYLENVWGKLFFLGNMGNLLISQCLFEDLYLPLGAIMASYGNYYNELAGVLIGDFLWNSSVFIDNSNFIGINEDLWENLGFIRISEKNIDNSFLISIKNSSFQGFFQVQCLFCLENIEEIVIFNSSFEDFNETELFLMTSLTSIEISSIYINNITTSEINLGDFESIINSITLNEITLNNSGFLNTFSISNTQNFYLNNSIILNISLINTFITSVSTIISLENCSFTMISCPNTLFSLETSAFASISDSSFTNITEPDSFFTITSYTLFSLSNVLIKASISYEIFLMTNVLANINTFLQVISNTFTDFFSQDHSCLNTELQSSSLVYNLISGRIIALLSINPIYFTTNNTFITNNNFTFFVMISMFMGLANLNNTVFSQDYFLNTDTYQYTFDFEMLNQLYVNNCVFDDLGVIEKKVYYTSKDNNVFFSIWSIIISSITNSIFIVSSKIDLVTGFLDCLPHGGIFISLNTTYIILDTNPGFGYKGMLIDHFITATFIGNQFINLRCNTQDFYHENGGVYLGAGTSLSYSQNDYILIMNNNSFINCQCDNAGALAIVSIFNVTMINNSFFNSTAKNYAGHLIIAGGVNLYISGLELTYSIAGDGGAFLLTDFQQVSIENLNIDSSISTIKGGLLIENVGYLLLQDSIFRNLSSLVNAGFLYIFQSIVELLNCEVSLISAQSDGGAIYVEGGSSLFMENNQFFQILSGGSGGAIFHSNAANSDFKNTSFINCSAVGQGGVLYFDEITSFSGNETMIFDSWTLGNGVIFIKTEADTSSFYMKDLFCNNTKAIAGACLYYLSAGLLTIEGMGIYGNKALALYIYWSFNINVYLSDVIFSGTYIEDNLVFFSGITVLANNWTFLNNSADNLIESEDIIAQFTNVSIENTQGSYIFNLEDCTVIINTMNIMKNIGKSLSLITSVDSNISLELVNSYLASASNVTMSFIVITNGEISIVKSNFTQSYGVILQGYEGYISITQSVFLNNQHFIGSTQSNEIYCEDCYVLSLDECLFRVYTDFSIETVGTLQISINSSSFQQLSSICFSAMISNSPNVSLINSNFFNFSNGNLKFSTTNSAKYTNLTINSCNFSNNSANTGSALYISGNFQIFLISSLFQFNKALNSSGNSLNGMAGCLFFQPLVSTVSSLTINQTTFINNSASFFAATVFSQISITSFNNTFLNNLDQSGPSNLFFSYPLTLLSLNTSYIPIASGQQFDLELEIIDFFQNRLFFDNLTILIINPKIVSNSVSNNTISIQNSLVQSKSGNISFPTLIVKTQPNSNITLTISGLFSGLSDPTQLNPFTISKDLFFIVRPCLIGEIILSDNSCFLCQKGTYSLIDPMVIELKYQKCYPCPLNCFCYGGQYITPLPGYYRKSNMSINAAQCENFYACLGSPIQVYTDASMANLSNYSQGLCLEGNIDTLCYYCDYNYGKYDETDYCKECAAIGAEVYLRLCFYFFIMIVYILLNCHFAETSHLLQKSPYANFSTFFKIIVNHSQHITIIMMSSTGGQFPFSSFGTIFSLSDYVSFSNDHVITNDCLIQKFYYNKETMVIFKEVFNTVLPIVFSLLSFLIWVLLNYFLNNVNICVKFRQKIPDSFKAFFNKVLLFIVLSTFIFYSLIVKSCFGLFDCMTIDQNDHNTYLRDSPDLLCWGSEHLSYVFLFGLPSLIIWGVIFPMFLCGVLRRHAKIVTFAEKMGLSNYKSSVKKKTTTFLNAPPILNKRLEETRKAPKPSINKYIDNNPESNEDMPNNREDKKISIKVKAEILPDDPKEIIEKLVSQENSKELKKFKTHVEKVKYLNHIVSNIEHSRIFVFFYKDFKPDYYYWECLIFFRKFILTFLSSMGGSLSLEIILFLMFLIVFLFIVATLKTDPYKLPSANSVEMFSLLVCEISIFSTLVFQSQAPNLFQEFVAVFCIGFNIFFYLFVGGIVLMDVMKKVQLLKRSKTNSSGEISLNAKRNINGKQRDDDMTEGKKVVHKVMKSKVMMVQLKEGKQLED